MKASIQGNNFFLKHIYEARNFLRKLKAVQRVLDGCIYIRGNDILMTILLKSRFYVTVVVSRSWSDPFRMLI